MPVQKLDPSIEEALVDEYKAWRDTGAGGTTQDMWTKHGVSKQTAYNVLRRNGVIMKRESRPAVPSESVTEISQAFLEHFRELTERNTALAAENMRLKEQLLKARTS